MSVRIPQKVRDEAIAAVDKGAAALDRRRPRWFTKINCKTLNLANSCDCVLGQIYGEYSDVTIARAIGRRLTAAFREQSNAERHGFVSTPAMDKWIWQSEYPMARSRACYHLLDRLWIAKIKERVAAADAA